MTQQAQNKKLQSEEEGEDRMSNFKTFIDRELDDITEALSEGGSSVTTGWEYYDEQREDRDYILTELRKYRHACTLEEADRGNNYQAGDNEDKFISLMMLQVIVNLFFSREVPNKVNYIPLILGSRCIAHPNIKSTDGNVLLIPNAVALRRNNKIRCHLPNFLR